MVRGFACPLAVASAVVLAMGLVGCGSGDERSGGANDSESKAAADCSAFDSFGDLSGTEVSVYGAIVSPEADPYVESFKPFEQCTGATINYEGDKAFSEQVSSRVQGASAPDIAFVPQPGMIRNLVETGRAVAAPQGTVSNVDQYFGEDWKAYGAVDGTFYAAPLGASVKSLVWYSPSAFAKANYEVPQTWEQLIDLSKKIASDNKDGLTKPWCAGFGDGLSTGWVGTDWIEDALLRTSDAQTYDKWTRHDIAFNDAAVVKAFDFAGEILKNDNYVNGGLGDSKTISTTPFTDAGLPILDGTCFMHRQGSFYGSFWPQGTKIGPDGDVWAFYLPAVDPDKAKPVIGGGDFALAFADRPEVQAFQTYLSSPEWANERAKDSSAGGAVTANKGIDKSLLTNEVDKLSVSLLSDPKAVFRFDGSDLMPSAVGDGTFWTAMVNWTAKDKTAEQVTEQVESSWPA